MSYLTDTKFLSKLAYFKQKTIYARITSLSFDEVPIELIEGRVTSGSINIDGASTTRRSCSLTLISDKINLNDLAWTLETKFKVEIGVYNYVDQHKYPEILWFPQGIYVISSFSFSTSTSSMSVSISGKDKMSFLNGDISGHFGQSTILDSIEEWSDEIEGYVKRKYELKHVIKDMVYALGGEKLENIFIKDLDSMGLKMVKYIGQSNLYIKRYVDPETGEISSEEDGGFDIFTGDIVGLWVNEYWQVGTRPDEDTFIEIQDTMDLDSIAYSDFEISNSSEQSLFKDNNKNYFLLQVLRYGDIAGYEPNPMVYNTDLIAQPGDTIVSMLTKIVEMLGNSYEFFYDVNGKFIFQKKKTYLDTSWTPLSFYLDGDVFTASQSENEHIFEFTSNELITSMSVNPGIDKVKNDFIVYGETEKKIPIHLRYAIDKKPTQYINWNWIRYYASNEEIGDYKNRPEANGEGSWEDLYGHPKQLIHPRKTAPYFSMSKRNFELANQDGVDNFGATPLEVGNFLKVNNVVHRIVSIESSLLGTRKRIYLDDPNKKLGLSIETISWNKIVNENALYKTTDQYVDWRELIYQMAKDFHAHGQDSDYLYEMRLRNPSLFRTGKSGYEQYYTDIMGFWPDIYRYTKKIEGIDEEIECVGWNQEKLADPNSMLYWLEFLEGGREFDEISVPKIGSRTQVAKNKKSTVLFEPIVPPILFYTTDSAPLTNLQYTPIKVNDQLASSLSIATFPTAAKTVMNEEINSYTSFTKSVTLSTIPIYSLEVNKKVKILTDDVRGQFVVNRISLPLSYNGTMSITLSEIVDSLY